MKTKTSSRRGASHAVVTTQDDLVVLSIDTLPDDLQLKLHAACLLAGYKYPSEAADFLYNALETRFVLSEKVGHPKGKTKTPSKRASSRR